MKTGTKDATHYARLARALRAKVQDAEFSLRDELALLVDQAADAIDELRPPVDAAEDDTIERHIERAKRAEAPRARRRRQTEIPGAALAPEKPKVWRFAKACTAGRHKANAAGACTKCPEIAIGAPSAPPAAPATPDRSGERPRTHFKPSTWPHTRCGIKQAELQPPRDRVTAEEDKVTCHDCLPETAS